jgi:ferritin
LGGKTREIPVFLYFYSKFKTMLTKKVETALNKQIRIEAESSQVYLSMASWAEVKGLEGIALFMYKHSDEERMHMLKLIKYVNERGGHAVVSKLEAPKTDFVSFQKMFKELLEHEIFVSQSINDLVHITLEEKDYATHNFLQWYVAEQIEEEALARTILDKINLIGNDKGGLYLFDRDVQQITVESAAGEPGA